MTRARARGWTGGLAVLGLLAAACARHAAEPRSIAWSRPLVVATGAGEKGPWQQNDSRFDYVDDPSVVLGPDGAAVVAWVDQGEKDVFLQVFDRTGAPRLARPVNVSRTPEVFSWMPRIALSPVEPDHVYVLWQEIVFSGGSHGGEIFFARSRDRGATFEPPINLSRSREGDGKGRFDHDTWHNGSLNLAVSADGSLHAAWTEFDGRLWVTRSSDRGASFRDPLLVVAGEPNPARAPALAAGAGVVYLAWTVGEDPGADIRIASSGDGGATFGSHVIVEQAGGYSDAPKLAVDREGVLHVAWTQTEGGPFDRAHVRYARSADRGKSFEPVRTISDPAPRGFASAAFPALEVEGARVVVTWELYPAVGEPPRGLGLAYSLDAGNRFVRPMLVAGSLGPGPNGSFQGRLMRKLAVRDGAIAIVNSALQVGAASRVWLVRGELPLPRVAGR